ncbi:MAG: tetratricopeptide repeat protein [Bacteroidota bacterium]
MKHRLTISLLLLAAISSGQSSEAEKFIRAGNDFYKKQEYSKAAAEYGKALQAYPDNTTAKFNQANTLYKQDQKVEAVQVFNSLGRETEEKELKSKSFYNKGVILSQQKNLEESIEAYKSALRNNPEDKEARENLQKALLELKKKTPPPKKQENKDKKKQEQPQQKQPQPKMNPREAEQRLKLLQQKEKEVQQRLQKEKSKAGGSQAKDW